MHQLKVTCTKKKRSRPLDSKSSKKIRNMDENIHHFARFQPVTGRKNGHVKSQLHGLGRKVKYPQGL